MAVPSNVIFLVNSQMIIVPVNSSQRRARLAVNAFPFGHRLRLLLRQSHTQPPNEGQHNHRAPLHAMNKRSQETAMVVRKTRCTRTAINGMEGPSSAGAGAGSVGTTTESCTVSMGPLAKRLCPPSVCGCPSTVPSRAASMPSPRTDGRIATPTSKLEAAALMLWIRTQGLLARVSNKTSLAAADGARANC